MSEAKKLPEELILIRPPELSDKAFIYATWLRGLYYGNEWFKSIHKDSYMTFYHRVLDSIFNKKTVSVFIASLKEDPDVILGYSVNEPEVLHWLFVKQAWRRMGIGTLLIQPDTKAVTHVTDVGLKLKPKEWIFDPFKI